MKKTLFVCVLLVMVSAMLLIPADAYAKKGKGASKSVHNEPSAGERIANETADAVADVLTGEDSSRTTVSKSKGTPPGLAKKGKTPPGWEKGKKTGWDKEDSGTKSESPIKQFVKGLFGTND